MSAALLVTIGIIKGTCRTFQLDFLHKIGPNRYLPGYRELSFCHTSRSMLIYHLPHLWLHSNAPVTETLYATFEQHLTFSPIIVFVLLLFFIRIEINANNITFLLYTFVTVVLLQCYEQGPQVIRHIFFVVFTLALILLHAQR